MKQADYVQVRSFAQEGDTRPRFGIRSGAMTAGNRLLHRHDYFEVLFFASEASAQRIALREYVTRRGSIFFISPMTSHQVRFDADSSCYVLYFDAAFLSPDVNDQGDIDMEMLARAPELAPFAYQRDLDFVLGPDSVSAIQGMCDRMLAETRAARLCSKEVIRANLIMLLAEVTQLYEPQIRELMHDRPPSGGTERHVKGAVRFPDATPDRKDNSQPKEIPSLGEVFVKSAAFTEFAPVPPRCRMLRGVWQCPPTTSPRS